MSVPSVRVMYPAHSVCRRQRHTECAGYIVAVATALVTVALPRPLDAAPAELVPKPAKVEWQKGLTPLDAATRIIYDGEAAKTEAETLAAMLRPATGLPLPVAPMPLYVDDQPGNAIVLSLDSGVEAALGREGYRLEAMPAPLVRITAAAPAGLFYGGQTLRQLLPPAAFAKTKQAGVKWDIPCCRIEDKPRFAWRGYMLDYSRHFFDLDYTLHLLDAMAMHKLNVFHMHLADDDGWRIEIKKYPKLTEVGAWRGTKCALPNTRPGETFQRYGGFFTQDQIRQIVAHAARLHINVMPEIVLPGHSLALCTAYPAVRPTKGPEGNAISPAKEANYAMVDDIMGELAALFPFDVIHIGGDEVNHDLWKDCPEIKAFMQREKITTLAAAQVYFTKRLEGILAKRHKHMIGWNEILNDGLQRSTKIMSWTGTEPGYRAARMGFPVVMAPAQHVYFDMLYPEANDEPPALDWAGATDNARCYAFDPLGDKGLTTGQSQQIEGVHGCLWSEMVYPWKSKGGWADFKTGGEVADYKTFPRLCALAEVGWTPQNLRNYAEFAERLGPHLLRLKAAGVTFRLTPPGAVARGNAIEMVPPFHGAEVRYTLDGSDPLNSPTAVRWDRKPVRGKAAALRARTFLDGIVSPLHVGARVETR